MVSNWVFEDVYFGIQSNTGVFWPCLVKKRSMITIKLFSKQSLIYIYQLIFNITTKWFLFDRSIREYCCAEAGGRHRKHSEAYFHACHADEANAEGKALYSSILFVYIESVCVCYFSRSMVHRTRTMDFDHGSRSLLSV